MQKDEFADLLHREEELCDELSMSLVDGPVGQMIHDPLMIQVVYSPAMNALINRQYAERRKALDKAEDDQNWERYIFVHERPYRIDALLWAIGNGLDEDSQRYWQIVGSVWMDSENIHENYASWRKLLMADIPDRISTMDPEDDRIVYNDLADTLTIYRGVGDYKYPEGMSWTLDRERAIWFANRYPRKGLKPCLIEGTISKTDVIAYFGGRSESEIVALPETVKNQKIRKL